VSLFPPGLFEVGGRRARHSVRAKLNFRTNGAHGVTRPTGIPATSNHGLIPPLFCKPSGGAYGSSTAGFETTGEPEGLAGMVGDKFLN